MAPRFTRRTVTVRVVLDGELISAHEAADLDLAAAVQNDAKTNKPATAPALAARVLELERRIDAEALELRFAGIGRGRWEALRLEHAPTAELVDAGFDFDPDTFPPAAFLASWSNREVADADLLDGLGIDSPDELPGFLSAELDEASWGRVWRGILAANLGEEALPKSILASALAHISESVSSTPPPAGSL